MSRAACVAYTPCPSRLAALRRRPTTRNRGKGGGIWSLIHGAALIIVKSCPDDHLRIETDEPELRIGTPPVARPRQGTPGRGRRVATCNRPQTLSAPLERGSVAEVHLDPLAPRGCVIGERRLALRAAYLRHKPDVVSARCSDLLISYGMSLK
jgi:hypothetical protein